jgi:hypothetical protein
VASDAQLASALLIQELCSIATARRFQIIEAALIVLI